MHTLIYIIIATLLNGLLGLAGAITLLITKKQLKNINVLLVGFAAGALIGGALFHFIPESIEEIKLLGTLGLILFGICFFYVLEKVLHWHHCHDGECDVHPFTYLTLYGDSIHNFIDGLIIAGAFIINIPFGFLTTFLIILHELPQEIADFGLLVHGGFTRKKALIYNFLAQLTAVIGGILGYLFIGLAEKAIFLLPFAAGGFLYIAIGDLIPELFKEKDTKKITMNLIAIALGIIILVLAKIFVG